MLTCYGYACLGVYTDKELMLDSISSPPPVAVTPGRIATYRNERKLFLVLLIAAALVWLLLSVVTVGAIWLLVATFGLLRLVLHSHLVTHLQGNATRVSAEQFPQLHECMLACCQIVGLEKVPELYVMTGNGVLNAFATRFLRRDYVVLLSDVVDALRDDEAALQFYIGHELGHIAQKHLTRHWWLLPVMMTPLLGAAYARAREYNCDQYGLACSDMRSATAALALLAAGGRGLRGFNADAYAAQSERSGGFWMAFNELNNDYPWLSKRLLRLQAGEGARFPRRHRLAWFLSAFVPRTGLGLAGAMLVYFYVLFIVLTISIPAFQQRQQQEQGVSMHRLVSNAYAEGMAVANNVDIFISHEKRLPQTVGETGFQSSSPAVETIGISLDDGSLSVSLRAPLAGESLFLRRTGEDGRIEWRCTASAGIAPRLLPDECDPEAAPPREDGGAPDARRSNRF